MRKSKKQNETNRQIPSQLRNLPTQKDSYGRRVRVSGGSLSLYTVSNGMVLFDACVPLAVAARMLAALQKG